MYCIYLLLDYIMKYFFYFLLQGVRRVVEEIEHRKISLGNLCVAHTEENMRITLSLETFIEKQNDVSIFQFKIFFLQLLDIIFIKLINISHNFNLIDLFVLKLLIFKFVN